jgi:hypothetical protein
MPFGWESWARVSEGIVSRTRSRMTFPLSQRSSSRRERKPQCWISRLFLASCSRRVHVCRDRREDDEEAIVIQMQKIEDNEESEEQQIAT